MKKRKQSVGPRIRGSYHLSMTGVEQENIRSLILRRRLQILVHSCIYYTFDQSLVSDAQWSKWGRELVKLQKTYPDVAKRVDYHREFKGFDPSTGYDLPHRNPEIMAKAGWLLERSKESGHYSKSDSAKFRGHVIRITFPQ